VTLERESAEGPTHNDPPLLNVRHFPRLAAGRHGEPAVHELVRARSRDRAISQIWEGGAELELYPAPNEELAALAPARTGKGFRFTFAYTVDDLETVRDYTRTEVTADAEP
jgi:acetoacetate decarboxylase